MLIGNLFAISCIKQLITIVLYFESQPGVHYIRIYKSVKK